MRYDPPLTCCPLCGGGPLHDYDQDLLGNRIARCHSCRGMLQNPQYSDDWLREFYAGYIRVGDADQNGDGERQHRQQSAVRRAGKEAALRLLQHHGGSGRILMVGCGDGLELEAARDLGWQPEGYDVDPQTTAAVADRTGVPIHHGALADLVARLPPFDAVFADQVIEHPKDPVGFLRTALALLRPRGLLFLATPNLGSWSNRGKTLADRLGLRGRRRGRHWGTRHHLFFFTPSTLVALLTRLGLQVLSVTGSLKPCRSRCKTWLNRRFPSLDSNFALVARKPD